MRKSSDDISRRTLPDASWRVVSEVVAEALELAPDIRAEFVRSACTRPDGSLDGELLESALALIASSDAADASGALRSPVAGVASAVAEEESINAVVAPERIGPWRPVRRLGSGGMGVVFEAIRDDETFEQSVAVKLVHPGFVADFADRFIRERSVLAPLKHPGIAGLLDGGRMPDGTPWLAMELVNGRPLTEFATERGLGIRDRIRLFLQACDAVAYAHQNLVVHRDLKPAHVLVDASGPKPTIKLLDFGIAKLIEGTDAATTSTGGGPLTVAYAAPEQMLGLPITTATDVYSLGLVLYELLTGQRAYDIANLTPAATEQVVVAYDPPAPSAVVADAQAARALKGDLDTVVLKAISKDAGRRYATAAAFAEDLRRYLAGRPVRAQPDSAGYRIRKFVARNRRRVVAAVAVLLLVSTLAAVFTIRLASERNRAELAAEAAIANAERASAVSGFLERILRAPNSRWYVRGEAKGPDTPITAVLAEAAAQLEADFADRPEIRADLHHILGDTYMSLGMPDESRVHHQRTLEIRRDLYSPPHPKLAEALYYASLVDDNLVSSVVALREATSMQFQLNEGNNFPFMVQSLVPWELDIGNTSAADSLTLLAYHFADQNFRDENGTGAYREPVMSYLASMRSKVMTALGDPGASALWLHRADSLLNLMRKDAALYSAWVFYREATAYHWLGTGRTEEGVAALRAILDERFDALGESPLPRPDNFVMSPYYVARIADSFVSLAESDGEAAPERYVALATEHRERTAALRSALPR